MANGRNKFRKTDAGRDAGGFAAIPWVVLDAPAYARLPYPARALLLEIARQFVRDNNGQLLCSLAYLSKRGWKSNDVITRARGELLKAGFIHETCKGHRPSKASWYAVTWRALDRHDGYDHGAVETFNRGAYAGFAVGVPKPTRQELYERHRQAGQKNASLTPPPGAERSATAPPPGVESVPTAPSPGAVEALFTPLSAPPPGDHLDIPSPAQFVPGVHVCLNSTRTTSKQPKGPARQKTADAQNVEPIATLTDLWAAVGCRSQWTSPRKTRLEVAKAAMQSASSRHSKKQQAKPLATSCPPLATPSRPTAGKDDTGTTRVRDEYAQDMSAWD